MNFKKYSAIALLTAAFILTGCNKDKGDKGDQSEISAISSAQSRSTFVWRDNAGQPSEIKIVNIYGEAISGAQILVGDMQGVPFRGNFLTTDRNGLATFPETWSTPASVTVHAQGYIRQTILNQNPGHMTIRLNTAYLNPAAELKGNVTNLPVVNSDKLVDFALAMPMYRKSDLLNIEMSQIISPYTDSFSAAGQKMSMPSNVSLPTQKENYIINVTLNKPLYRLKVNTLGPKRYVTIRGRFVFKKVVDEFRAGKAFHELINHFDIIAGGSRDTVLTNTNSMLDLPGDTVQFSSRVNVNPTAPQSDEVALVMLANEVDGYMMPTDVKRVTAGQATALKTIPNAPMHVVNFLKKQSEFMSTQPGADRMTASFMPYSASSRAQLLPLLANPTMTNNGRYVINAQALEVRDGINPVATSAVISDLVEITDGEAKVLTPLRRWEVFGYGWQSQVSLPQWPLQLKRNSRKTRVEFRYVGSALSGKRNNLDSATHVTHASADF